MSLTQGFHIRRVTVAVTLVATWTCFTACSSDNDGPPVATPAVTLPSMPVAAGRTVDITYRFVVAPDAPPFGEDYTVFVHAVDAGGTGRWTSDHLPPTPTSQWKPGTVISYTEPMTVPSGTAAGRVQIEVGLYSTRSRDRLSLAGDDAGRRSYQVGHLDVGAAASAPTLFIDGWYDLEAPDGEQGLTWRWTTGTATVWLRNPKRDATLVLDVDQPVRALSAPQRVTIRGGTDVIDGFDLRPGQHEVRRLRLPTHIIEGPALLRFTITVDKTFAPANVPELRSADTRELGIRVFQAYLDDARP